MDNLALFLCALSIFICWRIMITRQTRIEIMIKAFKEVYQYSQQMQQAFDRIQRRLSTMKESKFTIDPKSKSTVGVISNDGTFPSGGEVVACETYDPPKQIRKDKFVLFGGHGASDIRITLSQWINKYNPSNIVTNPNSVIVSKPYDLTHQMFYELNHLLDYKYMAEDYKYYYLERREI